MIVPPSVTAPVLVLALVRVRMHRAVGVRVRRRVIMPILVAHPLVQGWFLGTQPVGDVELFFAHVRLHGGRPTGAPSLSQFIPAPANPANATGSARQVLTFSLGRDLALALEPSPHPDRHEPPPWLRPPAAPR